LYQPSPLLPVLFQGDILVVPEVSLHERDPRIATFESRKIVCGNCKQKVQLSRLCNHCSSQLPEDKSQVVVSGLGARQAAKADPLVGEGNKQTPVLAKFRSRVAMISSASCDIDRQGEITFLGVREFAKLGSEQRAALNKGPLSSFFRLPAIGRLPECVVDFNSEFSLPSWCLGTRTSYPSAKKGGPEDALQPYPEVLGQRFACLSRDGLKSLHEARVFHQTRYEIELPEEFALEPMDPDRPQPETLTLERRGWTVPDPKWILPAIAAAAS
jgi:hypothetical protein